MNLKLSVLNGFALVFTIVMNYLSNTGVLNGNTMGIVSAKYSNYFTPAGYAFSIWGLIYIGLLGFVIYSGRGLFNKSKNNTISTKIGWWFVLSCIANSLWVVAWLYEYMAVSVVIMIFLLFTILRIVVKFDDQTQKHTLAIRLFVLWPFSIYAGWISVALIANIAAWLTSIGFEGWGISAINWTILMILIGGVVNIFMILRRYLVFFGLVGVWAFLAISVANRSVIEASNIVMVSNVVAILLLITSLVIIYSKKNTIIK
ncbi:hypothetical protein [Pedobacter flavus]|uniref:Tryptophan-rich sensory protein n=1 Tax=Pedobacter flavus TaxID=3113906 RepID=A0ABU7H325_9SPHI|nr:hypothetical protein [Pedobacter sp. VNH31]MEE1885725.1 hypothetical protein [Pedobacter sp. VNH31]